MRRRILIERLGLAHDQTQVALGFERILDLFMELIDDVVKKNFELLARILALRGQMKEQDFEVAPYKILVVISLSIRPVIHVVRVPHIPC